MKLVPLIVVAALISGCATQSFRITDAGQSTPNVDKMQPFFIGGIGQSQEINAAEVCGGPNKVARVESSISFLDGFLGSISNSLFTPHQARVYCTK